MKEKFLDESFNESPFEYSVYGGGYGNLFEHPLYEKYKNKIDKYLTIFEQEFSDEELKDILDTLKLSLENGKDFYTNAKPYMKKEMEEYVKLLEEGVCF